MKAACYGLLGLGDDVEGVHTLTCSARESCGRYHIATKALRQHDPRQEWLKPQIRNGDCPNWTPAKGQGQ